MRENHETAITKNLAYNPENGQLTWKVSGNGRAKGAVAGFVAYNGYIRVTVQKAGYMAHRIAFFLMEGRWPERIDHSDGDRSNNRWLNLREVTTAENNKSKAATRRTWSGILGVRWDKQRKVWGAFITSNKVERRLYSGADFFEACCLRKSAEVREGFSPRHGQQPVTTYKRT